MTVLNLFRGQCIGVKVDIVSSDCILTLDLEDYNRLPPLIPVGAPTGYTFLTQPDGTNISIDPRGGLTGLAGAFSPFSDGGFWPDTSPALDLVTGFLAPEVPGLPLIDFTTALSDLATFVNAQVPRISGATRWWLAPPPTGDGLILYVVDFNDSAETDLLPAPYEIDADDPDWTTRILPIKLGPLSWDWAGIRGSTYVRGGTPAPEGSGFATGIGNSPTGTAYIDAPGSITDADKAAIGAWHQNKTLVELLTGSATMPAAWLAPDYGDSVTSAVWDVGQTVLVTSIRHSRFTGHEIDATPAVVQKVIGRLVTPSGGLTINIGGSPLSVPFEWRTFTFERVLGTAGKATVVLHLLGPGEEIGLPAAPEDFEATPGDTFVGLTWSGIPDAAAFAMNQNADVWITVDDEEPADIEWDLEFGDIPAGSLTQELARIEPPVVQPVYHFEVTFDLAPPGEPAIVKAQLSDKANSPIALGDVPMEWIILANDQASDPVDTTGWLADAVGTTDSAGAVFTTVTRPDEVATAVDIEAVALPIV